MPSMDERRDLLHQGKGIRATWNVQTSSGKRSFLRAQRRAQLHGSALYKGRWYRAKALGACFSPSSSPPSRPPPLPPSGPLHVVGCKQRIFKQGQARRCGVWRCLSWNAGGLTTTMLDDLLLYATENQFHIILVQETHWRFERTWLASGYICIHGGNDHATTGDCSGLLTIISSQVCAPEMVRFADVLPGRIQHIKIPSTKDTSLDLINVYQYTRKQAHISSRAHVWNILGSLLECLPLRNGLLIMGDFNTDLRSRWPWVGPAIKSVHASRRHHRDEFGEFVETYDLCVANSWCKNCSPTSVGLHGSACIDAILLRRRAMTSQTRICKIISGFPIGRDRGQLSWHNPLQITVQRWSRPTSVAGKSARSQIDLESLHASCIVRDDRWKECMEDLSLELSRENPLSPEALNMSLLSVCQKHFVKQHVCHKSSEASHALRRWDIWRSIQARGGAGLHAIFRRWSLYCKFRSLSREARVHAKQKRTQRMDTIITGAQQASHRCNLRELYMYIRKLSPRKLRRKLMLRSKDGTIMHPHAELELLRDYFQGIFRSDDREDLDVSLDSVEFCEIDCVDALSKLPSRKAVPQHYAPQVAWKSFASVLGPYVDNIYRNSYVSPGSIPTAWKASWLVLVPKPNKAGGNPSDWRPISLQDPGGKGVLKELTRRATQFVWNKVTSFPQFAYLSSRGTWDAISRAIAHCHHTCAMARSATPSVYERKLGAVGSACKGGLQICIDLKGAFDKASRQLIQQALALLHLPMQLQVPLLAWYMRNPYYITHHSQSCMIESNIGVRQGCVAAPLLWVCFMHLWQMSLVDKISLEWVINCLTVFADDIHTSWTFSDEFELEKALKSVRIILNSLGMIGMEVNHQKTVCLLCLYGSQASRLRKKYCGKSKMGKYIRIPRLCEEDSDLILPLVDKHVYLGVVISYGSYIYQTVQHRIACARKCFMSLRPWWTKKKLALRVRVQLWQSCVWSSLTYGLSMIGLDQKSKHLLTTTVLKQLRWISQSPLGKDCESNASLLTRLHIENPVEQILRLSARHWLTRWRMRADSRITSDDVVHQIWERLKRIIASPTPLGIWHKEALLSHLRFPDDNGSVTALLRQMEVSERDIQEYHSHVAPADENPTDQRPIEIHVTEFLHCPLCDASFPTVCGLRHHIGRKHGQSHVQKADPIAVTPEYLRSLGQDGLPTCRRCGKRYVRWDEFTRHILEDRCHPLPGFVDKPLSLAQDKDLLKDLLAGWIPYLEKRPTILTKLQSYCALCNQWISRVASIGTHLSRQHPAEFKESVVRYPHMIAEYGAALTSPCLFCGSSFIKKHRCAVLLQVGLLEARAQQISFSSPPLLSRDERRTSNSARDGHVQGNARQFRSEHPSHGRRRRWKSAPGQAKKIQPRSTRQSRCHSLSAAPGGAADKVDPQTRGYVEHSQTGHLVHDFYEQQRSRSGAATDDNKREMEGRASSKSGYSHESLTTHSVCLSRGRVPYTSSETRRRISGKRSMERSPRVRDSQCRESVSLQALGSGIAEACSSRLSPTTSCRRTTSTERHPEAPRTRNSTSISRNKTPISTNAGSDHPIYVRDRSPSSTCRLDLQRSCQVESECSDRNHGNDSAPSNPLTLSAGTRSANISEQNREEVGVACQDLWQCCLRNPGSHCYMIASAMALANLLLTLHEQMGSLRFGIVGRGLVSVLRDRPRYLLDLPQWKLLLEPWEEIDRQHDVAEFMAFLFQQFPLTDIGSWSARLHADEATHTVEQGRLLQPLRLVPSGVNSEIINTVQECVDRWHRDQGALHAFDAPPTFIAVQLERFAAVAGEIRKTMWRCDLTSAMASIMIPVFMQGGIDVYRVPYRINAIILHLGSSVQHGHYTTLLRQNDFWWYKDDAHPTNELGGLNELHERNTYVFLLQRVVVTMSSRAPAPVPQMG